MVSRVKIKDLVSSTARYAKKAATAADQNKNKKLTATEARALPADLKDDYKRQAKKKPVVTPASFAADQAAYVAASAKKADKNKDGYLSELEEKSLPKDLKDNLANYKLHSGTPTTVTSPFVGSGSGTSLTIGAVRATSLPLSSAVNTLLGTLGTQGGSSTYGAAFKLTPAALQDALAHPELHPDFMNQLLFAATGTSYNHDYPDYYGPDGLSVSNTTATAGATEMADDLRQSPDTGIASTTRGLADLMNQPGVQFKRLSWTNNDDAAFTGLMAFNPATGQVASFGWFNEP